MYKFNLKHIIFSLIIMVVVLMVLMSACSGGEVEVTEEPPPTPSATTTGANTVTTTAEQASEEESGGEGGVESLAEVPTRTPAPTSTPGPVTRGIQNFASQTGLDDIYFLGLTGEDWINLALSVLMVVLASTVGTWLVIAILRQVVKRTPTDFDEKFLDQTKKQIRWLVLIFILQFSTDRLLFLSEGVKITLGDIYFFLNLTIFLVILWKLVSFSVDWYAEVAEADITEEKLNTLTTLLLRGGQVLLLVFYFYILLDHFGVNLGAVTTALGLGGLALSLAAQDTLSDMIAGLIILFDQPFRVGDRIEIQGLGTWGDVVEIGGRTTKIRTRDNRLVIVPNGEIGSNQVVNYTYPDPRYRVQIDIGIDYSSDVEFTRKVIHDAVRKVPGILPDKPVDVLYNEMSDSWMTFRVRWWIESYEDTRHIYDRVNTALQTALDEAGIVSPYPISDVNVKLEKPDSNQVVKTLVD